MRIVIDARIINSSTGRYVHKLLENLETLPTKHEYIVLVPEKDKDYWKPSNPAFTVATTRYKNYSFGEQIGFFKQLLSLKADLVHFCMPQQPILYMKKHVTTVHDLTLLQTYNSDKNWFIFHAKQLVGGFVFFVVGKTSSHIITPTKFVKKAYQNYAHLPDSKVTHTYEAADAPDKVTAEQPTLPFKQFLLFVGQQSDYKNGRRLMQAHQKLRETHPKLGLVFVGSLNASAQANKAWSEKQGFKNIHFTGFVNDNELAWLYKNCASYVFPSLMEGFGLPGLEAMSYGAPVASSNATCLPEVYGDAAHYFDPLSVPDMTAKIEEVLSNELLRKDLIKKGHEQVKKYSWKRMAQQTLAIYQAALDK